MSTGSLLHTGLLLLGIAGAASACDKRQAPAGQPTAAADAVSPDEATGSAAAARPGAIDRSHAGERMPAAALVDAAGKPAALTGQGRPLLVNLWATWCAPCIRELPSLAAAARTTPGTTVVAVSQDMDAAKARAFLAAHPIAPVTALYDPKLSLSLALGVNLPTTILYDAGGKERWRATGGRDWSSAASVALLAER